MCISDMFWERKHIEEETERLNAAVEKFLSEMTIEDAREFLSHLSMYDDDGRLIKDKL